MDFDERIVDPDGDLLLIMSDRASYQLGSDKYGAQTEVDQTAFIDFGKDDDFDGDSNEDADGTTQVSGSIGEDVASAEHTLKAVHFLVSSKCMILASSVFKAMLQGDFAEGLKLRATGQLELPLPDDNPAVFSILLDVIHSRNRKVPRQVNLSLLTEITVLVDKYQMQEAVEVISDQWIDGVKDYIPENLTPDVLPWLAVAWVFEKERPFREVTRILEREGDDDMGGCILQELPIPDRIIASLKDRRQKMLQKVFKIIAASIEDYQKPIPLCNCTSSPEESAVCDAVVLGTLLKNSVKVGIWPTPQPPYHGFTVQKVLKDIRGDGFDIQTLCNLRSSKYRYGRRFNEWSEGVIKGSILESVSAAEHDLIPLLLEDFK